MRGSFCVVGVDETAAVGENKVTIGSRGVWREERAEANAIAEAIESKSQ
jgi:hypothetical protein